MRNSITSLYLEWGLLAVATISAVDDMPSSAMRKGGPDHYPLVAIASLLLFGLFGLYLPQAQQKLQRLAHTLGQVLLILLLSAATANSGRIFPVVYLVLVIRSCLMYGLIGRVAITGMSFVMFVIGLQLRLRSLSGFGRAMPPPVRRRMGHIVIGLQLNFIVLFGLSSNVLMAKISIHAAKRNASRQSLMKVI